MKKFRDTEYLIGEDGSVYSFRSQRFLNPNKTKRGYLRIRLGRKLAIFIHRMVAETYLENPEKYECINHKDGDPSNNHYSNLEWCTQAYNVKHAYDIGLKTSIKGEKHPKAVLEESDIPKIKKLYKDGNHNYADIARIFNVQNSTIWHIIKNKTWRHVQDGGTDGE